MKLYVWRVCVQNRVPLETRFFLPFVAAIGGKLLTGDCMERLMKTVVRSARKHVAATLAYI